MRTEKSTAGRPAGAEAASAAEEFAANPFYERLLELRATKPAAYRTLSPATHLAVEAYVRARQSAAPDEAAA